MSPKKLTTVSRHQTGTLKGCAYFELPAKQKEFTPSIRILGKLLSWLFNDLSEDAHKYAPCHVFKSYGNKENVKQFFIQCMDTPPNRFSMVYDKYKGNHQGNQQ